MQDVRRQAEAAAMAATERAQRLRLQGNRLWHLFNVLVRREQTAAERLASIGVDAYYPRMRVLKPRPRRHQSQAQRASAFAPVECVTVPMLPRYLFARFDPALAPWRMIATFGELGGLACAEGRPVVVEDELIDGLRKREAEGGVEGVPANAIGIDGRVSIRAVFEIGETVRVRDCAFASFTGTVEKVADTPIEDVDAETRITVAVAVFGRTTPIELALYQVEKL